MEAEPYQLISSLTLCLHRLFVGLQASVVPLFFFRKKMIEANFIQVNKPELYCQCVLSCGFSSGVVKVNTCLKTIRSILQDTFALLFRVPG